MKKFFTLLVVGLLISSIGISQPFSDDFEGFTVGDYVSSDANWDTWSGGTGTSEDATISDDFNHTAGGSNAMKVISGNDIIYSCGNKTTGIYQIKFWYYVPTGQGGYFNVQHAFGDTWAFSVEFHDGGTGFLHVNDANHDFTYSQDTWIEVVMNIDLDADNIVLTIEETEIHDWPFSQEESGGDPNITLDCVNFYGYADVTPPYYVDDFEYTGSGGLEHAELELSATEFDVDGSVNETLTLTNTGEEEMTFDALVYYPAPAVAKNAQGTNNNNVQTTTKVVKLNSMNVEKLDKPIPTNLNTDDATITHLTGDVAGRLGWGGDDNVEGRAAALYKYDNNVNSTVNIKDYIGMQVASVIIFCYNVPVAGTTQVEVYEGRDGVTNGPIGTPVTTEDFTPLEAGQSNVTLSSPVFITGKDLFVGWTFTQLPGEHCVAMDEGPPTDDANWTKTGVSWSEVNEPTFGNFGIVVILVGEPMPQWLTLDLTQGTVAAGGGTQDIGLVFDIAGMEDGNYLSTVVIKTNDDDDDEAYNEIPVNLTILTGVSETEKVSVATYPNPTSDFYNIVSSERINQINIVSITGQLVNTIQPNTTSYKVETTNLVPGTYIFEITTETQTITRRVVVE